MGQNEMTVEQMRDICQKVFKRLQTDFDAHREKKMAAVTARQSARREEIEREKRMGWISYIGKLILNFIAITLLKVDHRMLNYRKGSTVDQNDERNVEKMVRDVARPFEKLQGILDRIRVAIKLREGAAEKVFHVCENIASGDVGKWASIKKVCIELDLEVDRESSALIESLDKEDVNNFFRVDVADILAGK